MSTFNLETVKSLANSGDFDSVPLSSKSTVTLLTALPFISNLRNWQGIGYELTSSEIDEIDEIVGVISSELSE